MKNVVLCVSCATLLSLASAAESRIIGPYASVHGGIATLNNAEATGYGTTIEFDTDPGLALTGALGYDFGANFRMETELGYQQNDIDKINWKGKGLSKKASGDISSTSGLLNGYYDFTNISSVTPFISAGIGLAKVELGDVAIGGNNLPGEADGTAMAYQVGGGFSYELNYNLALDLKYRYLAAVDLELDDNVDTMEFDYSSHNIYGGIRASF
ncbi:outer membrane protein [Candidatus Electronema sp. PJ]|uniref:outer membrane protein n=1 Tax=Candidatus Electronema sp. PJ TaxID=3401572 RepID=UPI003AA9B844